jgi:hypothetical protein
MPFLVRYGFAQLDALNGYAAGMPSPYYYEQLWQAIERDRAGGPAAPASQPGAGRRGRTGGRADVEFTDPFTAVCAGVLVELGRLTRQKKLAAALSPADEIAALDHARRLGRLRGHPGPTREDLLDGIRSCFVKGGVQEDGALMLDLARAVLAGTAVGQVPAEAGVPPLVRDFQASAAELRLRTDDSVERRVALDLYRRGRHRQISRLFHRLGFLGIPFATLDSGPDFVSGQGLERLYEHWDYRWTPPTESRLVECGMYGATLEEAAANCLIEAVAGLEGRGQGRSAAESVRLVVEACRMGLHGHTGRILDLAAGRVGTDPSVVSLAGALRQLTLLWESREPLEAHGLVAIPTLIGRCYERFCFLLHGLDKVAGDAAFEVLESLILVHEHLRSQPAPTESAGPDAELFFGPLTTVLSSPRVSALLAGGAAGLLHGAGRIERAGLQRLIRGFLGAAGRDTGESVGFLTGLLRARRELAWQEPALIEAVDGLIGRWTPAEFIERLPFLRLAFADLTPAETGRVAEAVARQLGGETPRASTPTALGEAEVMAALRLTAAVERALRDDGLSDWSAEGPPTAGNGARS